MTIEPIAVFRSPLKEKFGIPRQAGVAASLRGTIELAAPYRAGRPVQPARRPARPRGIRLPLADMGIQPQPEPRPAGIRSHREAAAPRREPAHRRVRLPLPLPCRIEVAGADLADGTPIYDIKPYVEYADSHAGVRSGFVDNHRWKTLKVVFPDDIGDRFDDSTLKALEEILAQDPRPQFQHDPERVYGMNFAGREIKFRVREDTLEVL